ncbi:hypothetical protein GC175_10575 [bacterium]|nr:hypothetical protein [bacterium]
MSLPHNQHTTQRFMQRGWIFGLLMLLLAACGPADAVEPQSPDIVVAEVTAMPEAEPEDASATPRPEAEAAEATAIPAPESDPAVQSDPTTLIQSLLATIPLRAEGGTDGFDGVNAFSIEGPGADNELWIAHSYGIRVFQPDLISHFVAIFDDVDGAWTELARIELECADYVDATGVNAVDISQDKLWITVDGGAGAHSGCFDLLRWDGAEFVNLIQGFNPSPGAGDVTDVDGDGRVEVVLNATDPYIFCYACGVRLYAAQILRWDGTQLSPVTLTPLPEAAPADLRDLNNRAVVLAEANLYPTALQLIEEALALAPNDPTVYWNAQEIRLYAENRLAYVDGGYPILSYVFYGDYAAAVNLMRELTPAEIFNMESPLIIGGPAEAWVPELSQYLVSFADQALSVETELAEAYFLRAWGRYLADPSDPAVAADLSQAAQLAPEDTLIQTASQEVVAQ